MRPWDQSAANAGRIVQAALWIVIFVAAITGAALGPLALVLFVALCIAHIGSTEIVAWQLRRGRR